MLPALRSQRGALIFYRCHPAEGHFRRASSRIGALLAGKSVLRGFLRIQLRARQRFCVNLKLYIRISPVDDMVPHEKHLWNLSLPKL